MQSDDKSLFMEEMVDVKPISNANKVQPEQAPKQPEHDAATLAKREAAVASSKKDPNFLQTSISHLVEPHDELAYKKDGVQEGVYRKLRLGKYAVEMRLDLQRKPIKQARKEVFEFIQDCYKHDVRMLLIQHGKGVQQSIEKPSMKSFISTWLKQFDQVVAFHSAQRQHGGYGAVYVLLRKSENEKLKTREQMLNRRG